jgi:hypothetical protein
MNAGMVNAFYSLTDTAAPQDARDPFYWPNVDVKASSDHPYAANTKQTWTLSSPGAARISVHFSTFDTESGFDIVTLTDKAGNVVAKLSGAKGDFFSPVIEGDTVTLTLTSDGTVQKNGFDVVGLSYQAATPTKAIAAK